MISTGGPTVRDKMSTDGGAARGSSCADLSASPGADAQYSQQYAVQVALVTMKERCQKLQERLISLERENAALRASSALTEGGSGGAPATAVEAKLREKVVHLQSQKSHLTHQIFIVASENKKLFDRLSRLTEANRSLGSHLSRISNTLNRHDASTVVSADASGAVSADGAGPPPAVLLSRSLSPSDLSSVSLRPEPEGARTSERGAKEESLEEISSKLIQSILQAKADLQNQYEQMVELQSDHSDEGLACDGAASASQAAVRDLGFSYRAHEAASEDALEEAEEEVRALSEKLAAARDALRRQQVQICALFAAFSSRKVRCKECEERRQEQGELDSLKLWGSGDGRASSADGADVHSQQSTESHNISEVRPPPDSGATGATGDALSARASTVSRHTQCLQEDFAAQTMGREFPEGESVEAECEKMCPLCSKVYGPESSFEEFQSHVLDHFPDADDDPEVTANFVVV